VYAEIIIPLSLPKNYTWSVPGHLKDQVHIGCRVEVSLKNKKYAGIVKSLEDTMPVFYETKDILNILDVETTIKIVGVACQLLYV
jgi:primosomal protein N' (replication factor Y)